MRFMLDTNICIYLIRRHPPEVLQRLQELPRGSTVISVVTYAELRAGVERSPQARAQDDHALALLTQRIPVLPFTESAAHVYGRLHAAAPERRRNAMDRLIAAHAVSAGLTLVTNNTADFRGYPDLQVENWTA